MTSYDYSTQILYLIRINEDGLGLQTIKRRIKHLGIRSIRNIKRKQNRDKDGSLLGTEQYNMANL